MKDNIYTIPLTDAFKSEDECPFCFINHKLENDGIDFMLGSAYMADDIRMETNKLGFCSSHYEDLYHHGNRLGIAMLMHTHLLELQKNLTPLFKEYSSLNGKSSGSFLSKLTGSSSEDNKLSSFIRTNEDNCYICNKVDKDMERYLDTFFFVWKKDPKFIDLVKNCKGFCLSHFADLIDIAPKKLSKKELTDFTNIIVPLMSSNLDRIEKDLSWFIDKFDYRNKNESWKTSKDAIPRGIQKLASVYVSEEE